MTTLLYLVNEHYRQVLEDSFHFREMERLGARVQLLQCDTCGPEDIQMSVSRFKPELVIWYKLGTPTYLNHMNHVNFLSLLGPVLEEFDVHKRSVIVEDPPHDKVFQRMGIASLLISTEEYFNSFYPYTISPGGVMDDIGDFIQVHRFRAYRSALRSMSDDYVEDGELGVYLYDGYQVVTPSSIIQTNLNRYRILKFLLTNGLARISDYLDNPDFDDMFGTDRETNLKLAIRNIRHKHDPNRELIIDLPTLVGQGARADETGWFVRDSSKLHCFEWYHLTMYPQTKQVNVDGKPYFLGLREYALLDYLRQNSGVIVPRQTAARAVGLTSNSRVSHLFSGLQNIVEIEPDNPQILQSHQVGKRAGFYARPTSLRGFGSIRYSESGVMHYDDKSVVFGEREFEIFELLKERVEGELTVEELTEMYNVARVNIKNSLRSIERKLVYLVDQNLIREIKTGNKTIAYTLKPPI